MNKPITLFTLVAMVAAAGCTQAQLRRSTTRQGRTVAEIQYQQVLDNIAVFAAMQDALPHFTLYTTGTTQVTDQGSFTGPTLNWHPYSGSAGIGGSRAVVESWGIVPVINPTKLELMRCAYRHLLMRPYDTSCDDCVKKLKKFFGPSFDNGCSIPHGWFCVGDKKGAKAGVYSSHYDGVYVWVPPSGMEGLTRFTLTILDIATSGSSVTYGAIGDEVQERERYIPLVPPSIQFYPQAR